MSTPAEPIIFDGTDSSALLIANLVARVCPLAITFRVHNRLYLGGQSFEIGTSFSNPVHDEILIAPPAPVKSIDIEFKVGH